MEKKKQSLFIGIDNPQSEIPKKEYWRLADYDEENNCFCDTDNEKPKFIFPSYRKEKVKVNRIVGKTWKTWSEENKTKYSITDDINDIRVYQIIDPEEFHPYYGKIDKIKEVLYSGINLERIFSENMLIVINKEGVMNTALVLKKNYLKSKNEKYFFSKESMDVKNDIHSLAIVKFKNEYILYCSHYDNTPIKIYKYADLPLAKDKLWIRPYEAYAVPFLKKYAKEKKNTYNLSNDEIKIFKNIIDDSLFSINNIDDFFNSEVKLMDYPRNEADYKRLKKRITEEFLHFQDNETLLIDLMKNSQEIMKKCELMGKKQWIKEKNKEFQEKTKELGDRKKELEKAVAERNECNQELIQLSKQNENFVQKNLELGKINQQLKKEVHLEIEDYQKDFTKIIRDQTIFKVWSDIDYDESQKKSVKNTEVNCSLYVMKSEMNQESIKFENLDDWYSTVEDNFYENYISDKSFSYEEYCQSICADFLSGIHVIISGKFAGDVADMLSVCTDATEAAKIIVPSDYTDVSNIVDTINGISQHIVVIEGILDSLNENIYFSIVRYCKDKWFIFSYNNEESLALLSKTVWDVSMYIDSYFLCRGLEQNNRRFGKKCCDFSPYIKNNQYDQIIKHHIVQYKEFKKMEVFQKIPLYLSAIDSFCGGMQNENGWFIPLAHVFKLLYLFNSEDLKKQLEKLKDYDIDSNFIGYLERKYRVD